MTASSRNPHPLIEIGTRATPSITVNNTAASETERTSPGHVQTDQTTTMVSAWMRHPSARITYSRAPLYRSLIDRECDTLQELSAEIYSARAC